MKAFSRVQAMRVNTSPIAKKPSSPRGSPVSSPTGSPSRRLFSGTAASKMKPPVQPAAVSAWPSAPPPSALAARLRRAAGGRSTHDVVVLLLVQSDNALSQTARQLLERQRGVQVVVEVGVTADAAAAAVRACDPDVVVRADLAPPGAPCRSAAVCSSSVPGAEHLPWLDMVWLAGDGTRGPGSVAVVEHAAHVGSASTSSTDAAHWLWSEHKYDAPTPAIGGGVPTMGNVYRTRALDAGVDALCEAVQKLQWGWRPSEQRQLPLPSTGAAEPPAVDWSLSANDVVSSIQANGKWTTCCTLLLRLFLVYPGLTCASSPCVTT